MAREFINARAESWRRRRDSRIWQSRLEYPTRHSRIGQFARGAHSRDDVQQTARLCGARCRARHASRAADIVPKDAAQRERRPQSQQVVMAANRGTGTPDQATN